MPVGIGLSGPWPFDRGARCCDSYVARSSSLLRLDQRRAGSGRRSGGTPTAATPRHTCLLLLARMLIGFGFCPHIAHTALSETVTCWESQLCDFAAQRGCNPLTCNVARSPKAGVAGSNPAGGTHFRRLAYVFSRSRDRSVSAERFRLILDTPLRSDDDLALQAFCRISEHQAPRW
jgi:hypothetical protein